MPCADQHDYTHHAADDGDTNFVVPDCVSDKALNVIWTHLAIMQMNGE